MQKWTRRAVAASLIASSAFLSQGVLADEYSSCRYAPAKSAIEYTVSGKQHSASISEMISQFGKPLEVSCGKTHTLYVLEKAIAKTVGGEAIAKTSSIEVQLGGGNYTTGSFLEYDKIFKSEKAVKSKIAWNSVIVVMTDSKKLHIYKGLQNERFGHVESSFKEVDLQSLKISLSGTEWDTHIALEWNGGKTSLQVSGIRKDEIKIKEN